MVRVLFLALSNTLLSAAVTVPITAAEAPKDKGKMVWHMLAPVWPVTLDNLAVPQSGTLCEQVLKP